MTRSAAVWLCVFVCGCHALPANGEPDPLVKTLVQDGAKHLGSPANTTPILREIEIGTPLADARATMERHGFSCWSGVSDDKGTCLHCTAYKRTPCAYKILVKLYYETKPYYDTQRKEITSVEATVDYDVWRRLRLN